MKKENIKQKQKNFTSISFVNAVLARRFFTVSCIAMTLWKINWLLTETEKKKEEKKKKWRNEKKRMNLTGNISANPA